MNRLLLLAALALLGLLAGARSQSCSGSDAQVLRSRRLNTLKANILTQLAPALPDDYREVTTAPPTPEEESVVETFNALRNASLSLERTRERKCQSDDFFAKPVTFFLGSMAPEGKDRISSQCVHVRAAACTRVDVVCLQFVTVKLAATRSVTKTPIKFHFARYNSHLMPLAHYHFVNIQLIPTKVQQHSRLSPSPSLPLSPSPSLSLSLPLPLPPSSSLFLPPSPSLPPSRRAAASGPERGRLGHCAQGAAQ